MHQFSAKPPPLLSQYIMCIVRFPYTAARNSNSHVLDAASQSLFLSVPLEVKCVEDQFKNTVYLWNYPLNGSCKDVYIYNSYVSLQSLKTDV